MTDPLRTAEWELSGFRFLQATNPKRYHISQMHYLEGMFVHVKLFDKKTGERIGNEIVITPRQVVFGRGVEGDGERREASDNC